jgi:uncharacterized membrane protein
MGFSQSFLGITPQILCWASLIVTVVGLVVAFYYTNITAFAKNLRNGKKKPASGVVGRPANTK